MSYIKYGEGELEVNLTLKLTGDIHYATRGDLASAGDSEVSNLQIESAIIEGHDVWVTLDSQTRLRLSALILQALGAMGPEALEPKS